MLGTPHSGDFVSFLSARLLLLSAFLNELELFAYLNKHLFGLLSPYSDAIDVTEKLVRLCLQPVNIFTLNIEF